MKRVLLLAATSCGLGLFASVAHAADNLRPSDFALRMSLSLAQPDGLHVLELNESMYRAGASRTLADLRIFNAKGETLAWAVLPTQVPEQMSGAPLDLALVPLPEQPDMRAMVLKSYAIRVERDEHRAVVEVAPLQPVALPPGQIGGFLVDARRAKDRSGQLSLVFDAGAADFASRVEILGSEDLVNWRPVASGPLALNRKLGEPVERTKFDLSRPPPFLRVQWSGGMAPQLIGARFIERTAAEATLPRTTLTVLADPDLRDSFLVDVPRALPIERLYFRPQTMNETFRMQVYRREAHPHRSRPHLLSRRRVDQWISLGQVDVMRIMRDGAEVQGEPLSFGGTTDRLRLSPVGAPTGRFPAVEAEWRPARIAFVAKAPGPYFVAIGRDDAKPDPPLDLRTALPDNDRAGTTLPLARVAVGSAEQLAARAAGQQRAQRIATEARWSRYVLWAVLLAAVAAMAWMAWRLSLQLRREQP
jgi:hypothetical protein